MRTQLVVMRLYTADIVIAVLVSYLDVERDLDR